MNATMRVTPAASEPRTKDDVQPRGVRPDHAEDDAEQPSAGQDDTRQVERERGPAALHKSKPRDRDQQDAERDVEPEDRLPRPPGDHGAADDWSGRDGETGHRAPDAERHTATLDRYGGREQREGERDQDRRARSLQRAERDQPLDARGERGRGRADREDGQADDQQPATAEALTE
jgi:hypothetical protein